MGAFPADVAFYFPSVVPNQFPCCVLFSLQIDLSKNFSRSSFYPSARIWLRGIVGTGVVRASVRASVNFWFPSISRTPCPIKSIFAVCVGAGERKVPFDIQCDAISNMAARAAILNLVSGQ